MNVLWDVAVKFWKKFLQLSHLLLVDWFWWWIFIWMNILKRNSNPVIAAPYYLETVSPGKVSPKLIQTMKILLYRRYESLYPFVLGSLEWPFSKLFSANVSWNQYKYIAFNIFLVENFDHFVQNVNHYKC